MVTITAPSRTAFDSKSPLLLPMPYFSQRDSCTGQGDRMCFSSSCAMAAEFLKPGCLAGAGQPDDRYLALVQCFGDTTNAHAQVAALERLGIQATFRTDGRIEQLIAQLRLGFPIPVGWLHQGPVSAPPWRRPLEPGGGLGSGYPAGGDPRPLWRG
ncbi:hypothetical protein LBMAG40_12760 [Cyanobium sp.]|jgi:hypothetical protein|nr:hypothetical protein LBMAG40_12760 [Cyanobium sp.]